MGLSVGSFAEDEACSWVKSTVLQWRDDDAGVLELVRYVGCLPLALGLASAHARVHGTRSPTEFMAALKRAVQPPQLEVGAKVELLEYDAEAQHWAVELSDGGRKSVRAPNLAVFSRDDCPPSLHAVVMLSRGKVQESVITSVSSRDPRLLRRQARHIGESVGPRVVEARCGARRVCWATCGDCANRRAMENRRDL